MRARLFNAAYEDYVVPFVLDEARLAFMEHAFDIDLAASVVAVAGGERIGLGNLARRGADGWIAGVGVVAAARGSGVGEALMRRLEGAARERGVERLWLEVIVENVAAARLYEKLGYVRVRELEVWTLDESVAERDSLPRSPVPLVEAHAWILERSREREPWQRSDATLARLQELEPAPGGIVVDGGAAVVRVSDGRVSVVQVAADDDAAYDELFRRAAALGPLSLLNLPAGHPAGVALAALGGRAAIRQHEMLLELER